MNDRVQDRDRAALRTDIQVLRGIAVLLVVLYHAGLGGFAGGFLGVDLFFVVSGYLITGLIARAIDRNDFSPAAFYVRRARRLLPAALAVFLLTALAADYLLTQEELHSFFQQLLGAVFGAGNIVLWLQSGYFDTASQMKPLLHVWSLGIEEQFYLLMPWLLLLIAPRSRLWLLLAGTLFSLALCVVCVENHPDATFYLLPTRAWELGLGAVGACLPMLRRSRRNTALSALALLAIVGLGLHPLDSVQPRFDVLIVCLATLWLLLSAPAFLGSAATWPLARIGDMSYSLYLVHWPLLAFAHSYYAGDTVPTDVTLWLVAAAFGGAALLHVAVEVPCRRGGFRVPRCSTPLLLLLPLMSLPLPVQAASGVTDWQAERRPNHGLGKSCEFDGTFRLRPECSAGATPRILVWGDSIAMLWPTALTHAGVVQATMSTCAPMLGISPLYTRDLGPAWAQRCIAFNDAVLAWLKTQPHISHVLLSSRFSYHIEPGQKLALRGGATVPQGIDVAAKAFGDTIAAIRALGKTPVVMAPPPLATFDVGICLERAATGRPIGGRANCEIDAAAWRTTDAAVIGLLRRVEQETKVSVLRPADLLCDAKRCQTTLDGVPLYRDKAHFSYRGVEVFAKRFELEKRILAN